jgi:Fe-S-cluster-containing hydrogenase component 2
MMSNRINKNNKIIEVNFGLCTGCRYCELICSFYHDKEIGRSLARIRVFREKTGLNIPVTCEHCEDPFCMSVCPVGVISREKTGAIVIDDEHCVGCRLCAVACPIGMIVINPSTRKPIKCDLCGGDPKCVKYCPAGAIKYVKPAYAFEQKRVTKAKQLAHSLKEVI